MGFFSKIFRAEKGSSSVVGIDIGSSSLKVVQLRRENGTAVLETYGELALGPYAGLMAGQATNLPAATIAANLTDLLREARVTSKDVGMSIPFSRSLLTLVELPRREDPEEQKTVIALEARKYIPVPVSEVQLDWFILPEAPGDENKAPSAKVQVLLVAVHNDQLSLQESLVKAAELQVSFYEIEIFSTIRSVVDEPVKPVMVLDIGASATKAYVVEHGVVALSHTISQGGQDVTRAIATGAGMAFPDAELAKKEYGFSKGAPYDQRSIELVFSRVLDEAKRTASRYEAASGKPVSGLVLAGGGAVTKGLERYAQGFFPGGVRVADPFGKTQAPAFMRPVLAAIGPEFAVAVGLALRKLEEGG